MTSLRADNRGQSFVEAMVAMTIIITAVSSALALVQSSINASRIAGSQVVAANLAREGVEVVRAIRDTNWLKGNAFSVGLSDPGAVTARARFDPATGAWTLAFAPLALEDAAAELKLTPQGLFLHVEDAGAGASNTLYRRLLTIGRICRDDTGGDERIVATVGASCAVTETWVGLAVTSQAQYVSNNGTRRTVAVEERLYDWR